MSSWRPIAGLVCVLAAGAWLLLREERAVEDRARVSPATAASPSEPAPERMLAPLAQDAERALLPAAPESSAAAPVGAEAVSEPALARLTVEVVDRDTRQPISGLPLVCTDAAASAAAMQSTRADHGGLGEILRTGEPGTCAFEVPAGRELRLRLLSTQEGYGTLEQLHPALAPGAHARVVLTVSRSIVPFHVRLVNEAGVPVAGARVELQDGSYRIEGGFKERTGYGEQRSDADGRFSVSESLHRRRFCWIEADGYGPRIAPIFEGHRTWSDALEVTMLEGATLEVSVSGSADGYLHLVSDGEGLVVPENLRTTIAGATDERLVGLGIGRMVSFRNLPPQTALHLSLLAPDGALIAEYGQPLVLSAGEQRSLVWDPVSLGSVIGRVVTPAGSSVDGLEVLLVEVPASHRGRIREEERLFFVQERFARSALSGADGSFTFQNVTEGPWWVGIAAGQEVVARARLVDVSREGVAQVLLQVEGGSFVEGVVLGPREEPVADVQVSCLTPLGWQYAQAGEKGAFRVGPLPQSHVRIRAGGGGGPYLESEFVVVPSDARDVVLRVTRGCVLAVRAVNEAGLGVPAELFLARRGSMAVYDRWNRATVDGEHVFDPLEAGTYDLVALFGGEIGLAQDIYLADGDQTAIEARVARAGLLRLENDLEDTVSYGVASEGLHVGHGTLAPGQKRELPVLLGRLRIDMGRGREGFTDAKELLAEPFVSVAATEVLRP